MNPRFGALLLACLALSVIPYVNANACCPDGWMAYKGNCYGFNPTKYEWGTAANICGNSFGGHLASISSSNENNIVTAIARAYGVTNGVWTGGNDIAAENQWKWTDGTEFKWTGWNSGELDGGNAQDCSLQRGYWVDEYCYAAWPSVCERPSTLTNFQNTQSACCPDGWMAYGSSCYGVFLDRHEWGTAENICVNSYGGHLANVGSSGENNIVTAISRAWGDTNGVWTGGNDIAAENQWRWTDGTQFQWTGWNSGEPDGGSAQDCILPRGYWVDEYCYASWPFICEIQG